MINEVVIVINPGSTSTKLSIFGRSGVLESGTIRHAQKDLDQFEKIGDQLNYRYEMVEKQVDDFMVDKEYKVVGVVGRGGIVKPLQGGTYRINKAFLKDACEGTYGDHASNLGSLISNKLKNKFNLKDCYTVDPVSCGNMWPKSEISGVPEITRVGRGHPLNIKMTARKIAKMQNIPFEDTTYVIAHLGGGISITLLIGGKLVDINDGLLGMGPFSPNRAGSLPVRGIMKICYSRPEKEAKSLFSKDSGFKAYIGTEDVREVIQMIKNGDEKAELIYNAFVYQVAKEIGAYYAASKCTAQAIIITGGIAYNEKFTDDLRKYVGGLTDYHVYPGENEMEGLAEGVFRVIDGEEEAQEY
jgi:butyrate kinase